MARNLTWLLFGAWLVLPLAQISPAWAEISGKRPTVVDGDTLILAGARIDLHGLDAPELEQVCQAEGGAWACGQAARQALIQRIAFHWVTCVAEARTAEGAETSICYLGALGGPELNAWLVSKGWALADRPGNRRYEREEAAARDARRGLWAGRFVRPGDWRQGLRLPGQ